MKKISLNRRNVLAPAGVWWAGIAIFVIIMLSLVRLLFPIFFFRMTVPFFVSATAIANEYHSFAGGFRANETLAAENARLASENAALALENQSLVAKDTDLSRLAGVVSSGTQSISASVVARPPESSYDTLIIAAGSSDGVVENQEVFGDANVPLGFVSLVAQNYARITLFSAPGIATEGWVGAAHLPITLTGAGAGAFSARVSRAAGIGPGDSVFLAGQGTVPVGTVVRADGDPASPTLALRIVPAINLFSLTWVRLANRIDPALFSSATSTAR